MNLIIATLLCHFFAKLLLVNGNDMGISINRELISDLSLDTSFFDENSKSQNLESSSSLSGEIKKNTAMDLSTNIGSNFKSNNKFNFLDNSMFPGSISLFEMERNLHENLSMFSNLLFSPIMRKNKSLVSELSFEYSREGIRNISTPTSSANSADKLINKLFGPNGTRRNAFSILRYGFLIALFNELNDKISKGMNSSKYTLHSKLIENSLSEPDCVDLLNIANKHFNKELFSGINTGIFKIICFEVINKSSVLEMHSWKDLIFEIIQRIKKFINSIKKKLELQNKRLKTIKLPMVPEIVVSGTEIRQRYLNIMSHINAIKKKEATLFNALIFTKKMAIQISAQYLPNGDKLVQECLKIIVNSNPALMREVYQRDKITQICRTTMGN